MDPFEPFGKELCQFHGSVKHVPYVPKRGMTQIHQQLIQESGRVIVVICDSSASDRYQDHERLDHVDDQERFSNEVGKMVTSLRKQTVLLVVGLDKSRGQKYYGNKLEIAWDQLLDSASMVFTHH